MRMDPAPSDEGPNGEESETSVHLEEARRQKSMQRELPLEGRGESPSVAWSEETRTAGSGPCDQARLRQRDLNLPNRRIRTRTYGGVTGKAG